MSDNDLKSLKRALRQTILIILGPFILAVIVGGVNDHYTTKQLKEDMIEVKREKADEDIVQEYMKQIEDLVNATRELTKANRNADLIRIERIESEITIIRQNIQSIGNKIGLQTRGL